MKLLQDVKTYENLQLLLNELSAVNLAISGDVTVDQKEIINQKAPNFYRILLSYLAGGGSLEELADQLERVEVLELTLAFEPNTVAQDAICNWVFKNVSDEVVLSFKKNPSIMSGALVTYKGKYGDFSGAKKLEEAFVGLKKELKL